MVYLATDIKFVLDSIPHHWGQADFPRSCFPGFLIAFQNPLSFRPQTDQYVDWRRDDSVNQAVVDRGYLLPSSETVIALTAPRYSIHLIEFAVLAHPEVR